MKKNFNFRDSLLTQSKRVKNISELKLLMTFMLLMIIGSSNFSVYAQISYASAGSNYTQNFDNLYGTVPANNTTQVTTILPSGWSFVEAGANANTTFRNDNGSSGTGDTYLDGATTSNERALGSYSSGSLTTQYGASFINNTGSVLTQFTLTYTGELWKDGGSASAVFNKLSFAYGIGATSITTGTYVNVTGLDFTAPVNNNTADATKDGNLAANRTTITLTVNGINWAAGQVMFIRWSDANETGNDDNLAIDDLTFSASAIAPSITTSGTLATLSTTYGTASSNTSFTVSGADLGANIIVTAPAGFEVSTTVGSGFGSSVSLTPTSGTVASTTIYVRLSATSTAIGSPYSGNVTCTSTGATTQDVATVSSTVNTLGATISGIIINNKSFDGNTNATINGTPVLNGILGSDTANVTLGGTPIANFDTPSIGANKPVTVTGYTLSGTATGNYSLSQPTGLTADITASNPPVINSALTANGVYGTLSTPYFITATASPTSFNAMGLPSGLNINTATGEISGTPTALPGNYNVTLSATNGDGTGTATLAYTIAPKGLTVSGATATNKIYDGNTAASITVTSLNGIYLSDDVTLGGGGIFNTKTFGTSKPVTAALTLSGADASKYLLTQPTGLSADITTKALTINGAAAQNKIFDGNTTAVITGTLTGVVSGDVVTLNPTGTFASSAIGNGIAVTSTATLSGTDATNYSLTQPIGLSANITAPIALAAGDIAVIGYNTGGTPDNFAILVLKDLVSGTKFFVNDNELTTASSTSFTDLSEGEASFTVKSGQTILAGTVIVLPWGGGAVSTTTYDWSTTSGFGLGNNNEEIYIYNASLITDTTPTSFIYFAKIGTSPSAIPTSLTLGTTAINPIGGALRYSTSGVIFTSCQQVLLSEIGRTTSNWNTTGATTIAIGDWTFTVQAICPTPSISTSGTLIALSTTYGTASSNTSFNVSGANLSANLIVTAPIGFEVSTIADSDFGSSVSLTPTTLTVASTTIYVRLSATATVIGSPYSGNIVCSSGSATENVATVSSTVTTKEVTISGIAINNKPFDGSTTATITGTPSLNGVLGSDTANVILGGTPIANFDNANIGAGKPVTITGYSLSGSAANNYSLTQPTGLTADITASTVPAITSSLTANAFYGTLATTYTITATNTPTSFNATGLPAGLNINTTTGEITGTPIANPGVYNVTISATNLDGTGTAVLVYTIAQKQLSISGATAQNKYFDGTTAAVITGTLSGIVAGDIVTFNGTGTFATSSSGNGIAVTSTSTLSGADAAKYTLVQPIGLTANITVLGAGDIAIIGYNTSGSPDNFTILVLKDLVAGTQFFVNDNELANPTSTSFTDLGEGEASFKVKTGQTIPAGTVIVLPWGSTAVSTTTYDWSVTTGFGFGNNNEEIYIYTAALITSITPNSFIYYAKIGASTSTIPSSLTLGATAITPSGTSLRYSTSATTNACQSNLLTQIGNTATNWNTTGATAIVSTDWSFNVYSTCNPPISIISGSQCNATLATIDSYVYSSIIRGAQNYLWEVTELDSNGDPVGVAQTKQTLLRCLKISSLPAFAYGKTYSVRVSVTVAGVPYSFSPACKISTPDFPASMTNCAAILTSLNAVQTCTLVRYASAFTFHISNDTLAFSYDLKTNKGARSFIPATVNGLLPGTTYDIEVSYTNPDGSESVYGSVCTMTTPQATGKLVQNNTVTEFNVFSYPNPYTNDFIINLTSNSNNDVQINVYNMIGRLVETKTSNVSDLQSTKIGGNCQAGIYNIVVAQGENVKTLRVVKR